MRHDIERRVYQETEYMLQTKDTIRNTAKIFGISKSTVHIDLSKRLKLVNGKLFKEIKNILDENFSEKHLRGGKSTKEKYLKSKKIF